jgi:hypothetical protein
LIAADVSMSRCGHATYVQHEHVCSLLLQTFGSTFNSKGYRVIKGCGVIQGDGIDVEVG